MYINKDYIGCTVLTELIDITIRCPDTYQYIDEFFSMINNSNSYVRTRGLFMIAYNSKWDVNNTINKRINEYLDHIEDEKPITSRQCLQALLIILEYKPELVDIIKNRLDNSNIDKYNESMKPLIQKDIKKILVEIEKIIAKK